MNIDTNINNYSVAEILTLFKIEKYDIDSIFVKVLDALDRVNETSLANNKQNILLFFRQCFFKLCSFYNYSPSETMVKNIDSRIGQNYIQEKVEKKIEKKEQFVGSLPTKVPEVVTVSSNIDKYARGIVNPIQRETVTVILTINSKFRDSKQSTTTDFSVMLTEPINNVVSLKMASIELMNSYYSISDYLKTNLFQIETYKINTSTNAITDLYKREIQISEGSYSNNSMVTTLNTIFSADPSLNMIETGYSGLKGKIYFFINNIAPPSGFEYAFNLYFSIPSRPLFLNYGWLMGFKKAEYIFTKDYIKTATPTKEIGFNPESPVDFTGTKFFLLEVTDYNNNSPAVLKYNTNDNYWFNVKDVLAKIPNDSPTYSLIMEDSSDKIFKTRKYFGPVKLQKLRIRLLDENGKVVDLNGSEMVISFQVESLDVPYKNKI
jgi:hypothetical protein